MYGVEQTNGERRPISMSLVLNLEQKHKTLYPGQM